MPKTSLDLTGKWEFKEYPIDARRPEDLDKTPWQPCSVPSSIFTCLITSDKIKKSEIDANPENFAWVSQKPWLFRKSFDAQQEMLDCDRIDLVFEGLDTIATIWLNDKLLTKTKNMFISHRFDVTKLIKPQNNVLMLKFDPAIEHAKKLMKRYTVFDDSATLTPCRAYIRKAQFQFGWDFCPQLPGCGIWKPVRLEAVKQARLSDIHIRTIGCNEQYADIKIDITLDKIAKEKILCKLIFSNDRLTTEHELTFQPRDNFLSTVIRIHEPALWFPRGYGKQHLYNLQCKLITDNETIDHIDKQFGIRTLKLNCSTDRFGQKFQFEVNGQPIYAKGANWLPLSIFAGSATDSDYEQLLTAAAKANINMLRVWAGGYYESEKFYQLCDQLGIMLWQDFNFTCAYYPDQGWFAEEIKKEATQIIKRLRNHPSLVLWCGNNEIDWMHHSNKFGKAKKFHGRAIYHKLLPQLVADLDPDRSYIPTTPFGQPKKPNNTNSGTFHQWDVWSNHHPIRKYICPANEVPRFVAEFGIQSLPNIETIKNFSTTQKLQITSRTVEKHNYQLDGNSRLHAYIADIFGHKTNSPYFVYLSQLTQAHAVKTYVEHLRANKSINSGVLFWQFNDCCPAISWSAIDHTKQPKALYYYAKRFFSDILITAVQAYEKPKANSLPQLQSTSIVAVNDTPKALTATLHCRLIDLFANTIDKVSLPVSIQPFSASPPFKLPKSITFPVEPAKVCLHLLMERNSEKLAENLLFFLPPKYIDWPKADIDKQLLQTGQNQWNLKLKSNVLAKNVQIETNAPAKLSDNFVDLIANDEMQITIDYDHTQRRPLVNLLSLNQIFQDD